MRYPKITGAICGAIIIMGFAIFVVLLGMTMAEEEQEARQDEPVGPVYYIHDPDTDLCFATLSRHANVRRHFVIVPCSEGVVGKATL